MIIKIEVDKADLVAKLKLFSEAMKIGLIPAFERIAKRLHEMELGLVPVKTGRLRDSITTTTAGYIVQSIASAVNPKDGYNYAAIQHYGGEASGWAGPHFIQPQRYMVVPLHRVVPYAISTISDEVDTIIASLGLG